MNPLYHDYQTSCFSLSEDDHQYYQTITSPSLISSIPQTSNLSTAPPYLIHFHAYPQKEIMNEVDENYKLQYQEDDHVTIPPPCGKIINYETKINPSDTIKPMIRDDGSNQFNNGGQLKWMSSKMRLTKKMMTSDQTATRSAHINGQASQSTQQSPTYDVDEPSPTKVRVCSDCSTTKTPLWRGGPQGPKSLCNACGIRQRKAKRAMAAAAASGGLLGGAYATNNKMIKEKRSGLKDQTAKYKKRCKLTTTAAVPSISENNDEFDELRMSLSKSLAVHHILIPQDEKEAAILLMSLSCGLVHG